MAFPTRTNETERDCSKSSTVWHCHQADWQEDSFTYHSIPSKENHVFTITMIAIPFPLPFDSKRDSTSRGKLMPGALPGSYLDYGDDIFALQNTESKTI